jgi:hypothetical protein
VAGKHEPASRTSLYLSMTTAALRAVIVVGSVILGVVLLARAFDTTAQPGIDVTAPAGDAGPGDGDEETDGQGGGGGAQGGGGGGGGDQQQIAKPPEIANLEILVLNDTDVDGLAGCTATELEEREGFLGSEIGDANNQYERTTIFAQTQVRDVAEYLKDKYFTRAALATAAKDAASELTVVIGPDWAEDPFPGCPTA